MHRPVAHSGPSRAARARFHDRILLAAWAFAALLALGCALIPVDGSRSASYAVIEKFRSDHPPYRGGEVVFSHEVHTFASCDTCHFGTTAAGDPAAVRFPAMALCFECHDGETVSRDCITCHLENRPGRKPRFHDGQWPRFHKEMAEEERYKCALCHLENDCQGCHQVMRPLSHTPRWMRSTHGRAAAHEREACATCHQSAFCENCHSQPPPDHTPIFMGFIEPGGTLRAGHKQAALIRGRSCLTCHSYADACARCHG
jgi:hypothetical protein